MTTTLRRVPRLYVAMLAVNLPLAAVMLTPQVMRSRVEALPGLSALGISLFIALPILVLWLAPAVAAVAERTARTPREARREVALAARHRPGAWWRCVGEYALLFTCSQLVGGYIAWLVPHIWRNPAAATDSDASAWVLSYPNYALQAVSMLAVICLAHAWYAARVTELVDRTEGQPVTA